MPVFIGIGKNACRTGFLRLITGAAADLKQVRTVAFPEACLRGTPELMGYTSVVTLPKSGQN